MTDRFLNALKYHASAMDNAHGQPRLGTVQSYDPTNGTARVLIQPEGILSGWLPVASQWIGSGWGIHSPLSGGEQVLVVPVEGDAESGVITGRVWSDQMLPPANTPAGECWIQHESGAFIRLNNQGQILLQDATGTKVLLNNSGTVAVTGQVAVSGKIVAQGDIITNAAGTAVSLDNHVHLDPDTVPPHSTTPPVGGGAPGTGTGTGSVGSPVASQDYVNQALAGPLTPSSVTLSRAAASSTDAPVLATSVNFGA